MSQIDKPTLSRRQFLRGLALTTGGAVLAACGAAPSSSENTAPTAAGATSAPAQASATQRKIVLMVEPAELSEEQQQAFMAENPDIALEILKPDVTRFYALAAAGTPPDIIRVQAPDVPQLIARNLVLDLSPYFAASSALQEADLAPANSYYRAENALAVGSGAIYGMTKDWSPDFTLFANTDAFAEANLSVPDPATPLSYAAMAELGRQLTKREGDRTLRFGLGFFDGLTERNAMNMLAEQGVSLYSDDFEQILLTDSPQAQEVLRYFYELAKEGVIASPINPSAGWSGGEFVKGSVALVQYGYWFQAMAESDVTKDKVTMLAAPTWAEQRLDPTMTATGWVVSQKTADPATTWRVFEWYMGGQPAIDRFGSGWGVPSLKSKYELLPSETAFQQQTRAVLDSELPYAEQPLRFNPYLTGSSFKQVWDKHFEQALRDDITFEQLLQNVEQELNTAIQDGKSQIA
jgi:multiple sugar transport system substrate-binding protein